MITIARLLTLAALSLCLTAHAAVELSPTLHEYVAEGIRNRELIFSDKTKDEQQRKVSYTPPAQWSWRGSPALLLLTPPNVAQAEARIEQAALPAPRAFDEPYARELVEGVIGSVPTGSQNVVVVEQQENPVLIGGQSTFGVLLSYDFYGQSFRKSVVFLNLPDSQLVFRFTARKENFAALEKEFRGSLFTWQWAVAR